MFIFDSYRFDTVSNVATFSYSYETFRYVENIEFHKSVEGYDASQLDRALFLAFMLIGTSYYKAFPTTQAKLNQGAIDTWQANFFSMVYQEGLSQFAFENQLKRADLLHFEATDTTTQHDMAKRKDEGLSTGVLSLQSGGKDSLLVAQLLKHTDTAFSGLYISSSSAYPEVLEDVDPSLLVVTRHIDRESLRAAHDAGGLNGHVPVTYIVLAISLIQAVLLQKMTILAAIGHEGEEPHAWIDDLPINHQWSKTWQAEKLFKDYVHRYISSNFTVGSPLRQYSELKVAELFTEYAWDEFGNRFSSCNQANYKQGASNKTLTWCGQCPKCANSYLLFAPFVDPTQLKGLFGGRDLFAETSLVSTFKGLLGVDNVLKPFECVGEVDELRYSYHRAIATGGYVPLAFHVPETEYNYEAVYDAQDFGNLLGNST